MKYCSKCGKELMDEAVICPGCGCFIKDFAVVEEIGVEKSAETGLYPQHSPKVEKRKKKKAFKIIVIAACILAAAAISFGVVYFLKPTLFMLSLIHI